MICPNVPIILNAHTKAVNDVKTTLGKLQTKHVGKSKVVGSGIIFIRIKIRENIGYIHEVTADQLTQAYIVKTYKRYACLCQTVKQIE